MKRIEMSLAQRPRDAIQALDVGAPSRHRIVGVQPHRFLHRLPQPFDIGLAEYLLGPGRIWHRDDRPVHELPADQLVVSLLYRHGPQLSDPCLIKVAKQIRVGLAGDRDHRAVS